ncbi:hypothetical protein RchiOBHm_Chr5g0064881 [Rosa chinensis]|uniref:Uncharacterized protein n=1 Tax=Rosa chinensis TaxID=74649 RepID=A0A2P6QIR8_ROSCH|nr:hypothetical protein RchiOBHm_Chr5g0064881 [Rosa chinensis]
MKWNMEEKFQTNQSNILISLVFTTSTRHPNGDRDSPGQCATNLVVDGLLKY